MMLCFERKRWLRAAMLWVAAVGCSEAEPKDTAQPSCEEGPLLLELAQRDGFPIGAKAPILYGHPPQGGVPYAPYEVRFRGVPAADQGVTVQMELTDPATGALLGDVRLAQRFLCSNTGEDQGFWVGGEVHIRFWEYDLDSLLGRAGQVEAIVFGPGGEVLDARTEGVLERLP